PAAYSWVSLRSTWATELSTRHAREKAADRSLRQRLFRMPESGSATRATHPFGQLAAQAEHAVDGLLRTLRLGNLVDQRRANHRAFGALGHFGGVLRGADAEADAHGQVGVATQA